MGPLFRLRCRDLVEKEFRRRGYSRRQIARVVDLTNGDTIEAARERASIAEDDMPGDPDEGGRPILEAIGEWLKAIAAWFRSEEGQAFLKKLFEILLSLLIGLASVGALYEDDDSVKSAFDVASTIVDCPPEAEANP